MGAYDKLPGEERDMVGAFSVECPEFGAPPGFACRKPKGKSQYASHKARRERAYAQAFGPSLGCHRLENGPVHAHKLRTGAFICLHIHPPPQDG
jgi:hypothetical protein